MMPGKTGGAAPRAEKKPVIGVTASWATRDSLRCVDTPNDYVQSVEMGGGLPVVVPLRTDVADASRYAALLDGLVMTGGVEDVHPLFYGENPIVELNSVMPERDNWETALMKAVLDLNKPVLAICRGMQLMNAAFGGTLYQHLPAQVKNVQGHCPEGLPMHYLWHRVNFEPGSMVHGLFNKDQIRVNSFHHQAVKEPAPGFKVCARSEDGIIEAMESTIHRFAVGIQWHPETLAGLYPQFITPFSALTRACLAN